MLYRSTVIYGMMMPFFMGRECVLIWFSKFSNIPAHKVGGYPPFE